MKKLLSKIRAKSIHTRMNLFLIISFLLFSFFIIFLIISFISFGNSYNQIVRNITAANAYNLELKEDVDYSVYLMISTGVCADRLEEKTGAVSPYTIIQNAREVFIGLDGIATGVGNARRIEQIKKGLITLEKRMDEINETVELSGHYDKNMERLDKNIRILTEVIQEEIQRYIYYEAASMESTRIEIAKKQGLIVKISILMLALILVLSGIINWLISRSITKPIQELCNLTKKVGRGEFETSSNLPVGDEISILTNSFNGMVGEIRTLIEDVKEEQKNLRVTELKLLQAQINPHFLYNTLDTIVWLAEVEETKSVVDMVTSLSSFFRHSLSDGLDYILIKEEEAQIRSYLEIQSIRYRDILEYEIEIEDEIKSNYILKLILQPLVENALYHGIKNKRGMGKIKVSISTENQCILICVEDNGIGIEEEKLEELIYHMKRGIKKTGFGLVNVDERIRLHYGEQYGVFIESKYGFGTKMKVLVPMLNHSPEENKQKS